MFQAVMVLWAVMSIPASLAVGILLKSFASPAV
jgi:hypothetical protein